MRKSLFRLSEAAISFAAVALSSSATVQGAGEASVIGARSYVTGSAKVTVTGSFQIAQNDAINNKASYSNGEMTWLHVGDSGSSASAWCLTTHAFLQREK